MGLQQTGFKLSRLDGSNRPVFLGKYRAKVTRISDPNHAYRIKVTCESIYAKSESPWCVPCFPSVDAQPQLPAIGSTVWIEFEDGDANTPIWVGRVY